MPQVEDINNDGKLDFICGEYGKQIHLYYGDGNGGFSSHEIIADHEGTTDFGNRRFTGAALADINGDGLSDMFVTLGCGEPVGKNDGPGEIKLFLNTGTKEQYQFTCQGNVLDTNGKMIMRKYHRLLVEDMDNDGLLDLVTGETDDGEEKSELRCYRNIGTENEPLFDTAVVLAHVDGSGIDANYAIRFGISDIDNDGVKDIFLNSYQHQYGRVGLLKGELSAVNVLPKEKVRSDVNNLSLRDGSIHLNSVDRIMIYDLQGRVLFDKQISSEQIKLSKAEFGLSAGVYLCRLFSSSVETTVPLVME